MLLRRAFPSLIVMLSLAACGGTTPAPVDAGTDAPPPPDGGPPFACELARRVDGVLGDTVTVMLDTTMTTSRPRDLGLSCGNVESEVRWARQEVIEFHVPGDGPVAIDVDTTGEGTLLQLNSVVQVRRDCATAPTGTFPPTCFDDVSEDELRGRGSVAASGGDVLYFYVTGFSDPPAEQMAVDEGPIQVDFFVRANAAPTLTAGFVRLAENDVMIGATGMDADSDLAGIALNFLGPDGELLDIWGDGAATMDGDVIVVTYNPAPTTPAYDDFVVIRAAELTLGQYLRGADASAAILRLFDRGNAVSGELEVPITEATLVGYQEACDATHACRSPMVCSTGTCEVFGDALAVCESATPVTIATPTDTATTATVTGVTGAGYGQYSPVCVTGAGSAGAETVYAIEVPTGTFDLLVTTDLPGTGATDTIVYVRSACPDSGSELACNDDIAYPDNTQSAVELRDIAPGRYSVFVEMYGGIGSGTAPHAIQFTLRPVLATGATCDPAGVTNRCAAGACASGTCP